MRRRPPFIPYILFAACVMAVSVGAVQANSVQCVQQAQQLLTAISPATKAQLLQILQKAPQLKNEALGLLAQFEAGKLSLQNRATQEALARIGAQLQDSGELPGLIKLIVEQAKLLNKLPKNISPEKADALAAQFAIVIEAQLTTRGLTRASQGVLYEDWMRLSARVGAEVEKAIGPLRAAQKADFSVAEFLTMFEAETASRFTAGNVIRALVDGPESFAMRDALFAKAKHEISIMTWAVYDDVTGAKYSQLLVQKAKEGVKVRILVDGQIAMQPGHAASLKYMEDNGVEVIRWLSTDPKRRFDGQHRKFIIVDHEELVGGGMNFGDVYSHLGPEGKAKWRDTDLYVKGPAVSEAERLFASLWNEQVAARGAIDGNTLQPVDVSKITNVPPQAGGAKLTVINHVPGADENILKANLLAIESAKESIDIENAYFILSPIIYRRLLQAKARGVKIRILTNSAESIDEPIVTYPILRSVNRLREQGFEVYLKSGKDTLHSKIMRVDDRYAWIGSYNFHPRSHRYEGEVIFGIADQEFAGRVKSVFEQDLAKAVRVDKEIPLPPNLAADIGQYLFYDQL